MNVDNHTKLVIKASQPLHGEVGEGCDLTLPGDKSLSHRAALFAALAIGESHIDNFQVSGVTRAMLNSLTALGIVWELDATRLQVLGKGLHGFRPPVQPLDCGNSATTIRLQAGALAASGVPAVLDGSAGLRSRPMNRIVEPLQQMRVPIQASPNGGAPLALHERTSNHPLIPLDYCLPVASAQVKSCLLLASLDAPGRTTLSEPGPSRDHTERMLRSMGAQVESLEIPNADGALSWVTHLIPPQPMVLSPLQLSLPGDISAAAFLIVAALITPGSQLTLRGIGLNPTRTGLLDVLLQMGGDLRLTHLAEKSGEPTGDLTVKYSQMHGFSFSPGEASELVVRMIDEFPAFAVAAAYAQGETVVCGAQELRLKESDRISAICQELSAVGVKIRETHDGFVLAGGRPLTGGEVQPHKDHRLAMALAVAGLACEGTITLHNPEIIAESFPSFVPTLQTLGAEMRLS